MSSGFPTKHVDYGIGSNTFGTQNSGLGQLVSYNVGGGGSPGFTALQNMLGFQSQGQGMDSTGFLGMLARQTSDLISADIERKNAKNQASTGNKMEQKKGSENKKKTMAVDKKTSKVKTISSDEENDRGDTFHKIDRIGGHLVKGFELGVKLNETNKNYEVSMEKLSVRKTGDKYHHDQEMTNMRS